MSKKSEVRRATNKTYKYDEVNSKIMELKEIITKSKEEFLQAEREWFPFMSTEEYYKYMIEDVDSCKNCGTVYWKNCNKRCDCGS